MDFGFVMNIILAVFLFIFTIRDILLSNIAVDFSNSNWFFKWFLSPKQHIAAKQLAKEMGFDSNEDVIKKTKKYKGDPCEDVIKYLSECIHKDKYFFGSKDINEQKHTTDYYVDIMGFTHKKDNCEMLYKLISNLIKHEGDYHYVFSTKDMNMSLLAMFPFKENVISIAAKENNNLSEVISKSNEEYFINYEGLRELQKYYRKNSNNPIKGIAVTCNLADGKKYLEEIIKFNEALEELKKSGEIGSKIQIIKTVYLLCRVIDNGDKDNFDIEYDEAGLKCYRYFDLNDDKKKFLLSISKGENESHDFPCYKCMKKKGKPKCKNKNCYKDR